MHPKTKILIGDVRQKLRALPDDSIHLCVTSPPFWGLRAYGTQPQIWGGDDGCEHAWGDDLARFKTKGSPGLNGTIDGTQNSMHSKDATAAGAFCQRCGAWRGELGSEPTPELFCRNLVLVFQEVKRVLRPDGLLFLNMGDSYASGGRDTFDPHSPNLRSQGPRGVPRPANPSGLKPKDLVGVPWRCAFALQADGWYLRSDIPWVKRNPIPESTLDRPAKALENVFMLAKSDSYYFDMQAVKKAAVGVSGGASFGAQTKNAGQTPTADGAHAKTNGKEVQSRKLASPADRAQYDVTRHFRNADLWFESLAEPHGLCCLDDELIGLDVTTESFPGAHFATFPRRLVEPFVKCGSSERGCCETCGAPWTRIVETPEAVDRLQYSGKFSDVGERSMASRLATVRDGARFAGNIADNPFPPKKTTGWQASCACGAAVVPCTVLDPFLGSGTTALVANALGRDAIGIELNPTYADMAKRRIARGYAPAPKPDVAAGQGTLFE